MMNGTLRDGVKGWQSEMLCVDSLQRPTGKEHRFELLDEITGPGDCLAIS